MEYVRSFSVRLESINIPSIRPSVKFFCNMDYDPFEYMRNHDKVYGMSSSYSVPARLLIRRQGSPSPSSNGNFQLMPGSNFMPHLFQGRLLFQHFGGRSRVGSRLFMPLVCRLQLYTDFMAAYPEHINKHNSLEFVSNDQGNSYNL